MTSWFRIRVDAAVDGPLAIFSGESDASADKRVARDQYGNPRFEASSIAGPLRAAVDAVLGDDRASLLFGSLEGGPSRAVVHDPELRFPGTAGVLPQLRWRNVIDRDLLATIDKGLFTEERWPAGLPYRFRIDVPENEVGAVLTAFKALTLPGLGVGSGPVPLRIESMRVAPLPTVDGADALERARSRWRNDWSAGWQDPWSDDPTDTAWSTPDVDTSTMPIASKEARDGEILGIDVELVWTLRGPLKTGRPLSPWESVSGEPDHELFVADIVVDDHLERQPGIAFSGVHGVLRPRAERFLASRGVRFNADPREATGLVASIFGSPGAGADEEGNAGLLHTSDFLAPPAPEPVRRERLAIDRLTGGPYPKAKWTERLLPSGTTLIGRVSLRHHRLTALSGDAVAALAAALRDIHAGRAGIGAGVSVGNGEVELAESTVTVHVAGSPPSVSCHPGPNVVWSESILKLAREGTAPVETNREDAP